MNKIVWNIAITSGVRSFWCRWTFVLTIITARTKYQQLFEIPYSGGVYILSCCSSHYNVLHKLCYLYLYLWYHSLPQHTLNRLFWSLNPLQFLLLHRQPKNIIIINMEIEKITVSTNELLWLKNAGTQISMISTKMNGPISTANTAQFHSYRAWLAVLISW